MYKKKYQIFTLVMLPMLILLLNSCATWQRLPGEETADAQVYIKRCSTCHAVPHPSCINYHQWKHKIVVLKDKQMPVITAREKESVLSYIETRSGNGLKTYILRCGQCHITPEMEGLRPEEWENLIVVLDGNMPVFSEDEKSSILRYLQTFAKE